MAAGGGGASASVQVQMVNPASAAVLQAQAAPAQQAMAPPAAAASIDLMRERQVAHNTNLVCPHVGSCLASIVNPCAVCNCHQVEVSTASVVLVCGRLTAVLDEPGLYIVNPMCTETKVISKKKHAMDLPDICVLDSTGSPIIISGVVNYQIADPVAAALNVANVTAFVRAQAIATTKVVCKRYRYTSSVPDEVTLKGETSVVTETLAAEMNKRCAPTGAQILSVNLTDISYRADIAQGMLAVQAADARIAARRHIVQGAVDIASSALTQLRQGGLRVPEDEQFRYVRDLLPIISGSSAVTPTLAIG